MRINTMNSTTYPTDDLSLYYRSIPFGIWYSSWCYLLLKPTTSDAEKVYLLSASGKGNDRVFMHHMHIFRAAFGNIITASLKNETALRFAGMFGSFAFLWKLVNNGMRIYRDKDDRLNGLVAGAVAGLAILCEKQEKRVDIAQQLFVR